MYRIHVTYYLASECSGRLVGFEVDGWERTRTTYPLSQCCRFRADSACKLFVLKTQWR